VLGLEPGATLVLPVVMIRSLGAAVINSNEKLVIETELRDAELYSNETLYYWVRAHQGGWEASCGTGLGSASAGFG
jgi:hypothetical protein